MDQPIKDQGGEHRVLGIPRIMDSSVFIIVYITDPHGRKEHGDVQVASNTTVILPPHASTNWTRGLTFQNENTMSRQQFKCSKKVRLFK